ncbi:MAG: ferrous iron transport protein B, partial [Actinobacteria bacterium]|nr:ferrous iron transport protein B [Actinomycetota bacterium]
MKYFALVGNPNAGKTTLFNDLTGTSQHVGNWPGVTVEKKEGSLRQAYGGDAQVVDLPGVYSLNPHSIEEKVARTYIIDEKPDVIIDVVEATNLERNLFLTCQIAELGVPVVVALNMMDEAEKAGHRIDVEKLSELLGLPVVAITAVKGEGVAELVVVAKAHEVGHNSYRGPSIPRSQGDSQASEEEESANAAARYAYIEKVAASAVRKVADAGSRESIGKADAILTNKWVGIPIFLLIMFSMFHVTFSENFLFLQSLGLTAIPSPGVWLQSLAESGIAWFGSFLAPLFIEGSWAYGLVIDGVIGGVGSVLSFLPQIMVLFFFLTIFEDIGYMSRVAFIMDRVLRTFGLSGKSFLPMLMGFGCTVPAAMACRTMENEDDRKMTLFLVPFMSCGARAPIFLVFCAAFFP